MDKVVTKFLADVLYIKKIICFEEFDDIMQAKDFSDLDNIVEKMLKEEYNVYKKGETYLGYGKHSTRNRGRKLDDTRIATQDATIHSPLHDGAIYAQ